MNALNRRVQNLEEDLEKTEEKLVAANSKLDKTGYPLIIFNSFVLKYFLSTFRVISSGSCLVKLGVGCNKFLLSLFQIFLKVLHSSVKSIHLCLGSEEGFFLLFKLKADNSKLLSGEIKLSLQLSCLCCKLRHFIFSLGSSDLCYFAGFFANITSVTSIVLLHLHGLHLLLDSIHVEALVMSASVKLLFDWR